MECWADILGGCDGGKSGEHIISQSVFTGKRVTLSGMPWCLGESKTIPLTGLKANILCRKHNSKLSELDQEAQEFQSHIQAMFADEFSLTGPKRRDYKNCSGWLVSRWLCKCYCNLLIASKREVQQDFIRYVFGYGSRRRVLPYAHVFLGMETKKDPEHVLGLVDFFDDRGHAGFRATFCQLEWVITNFPLEDLPEAVLNSIPGGPHRHRDFMPKIARVNIGNWSLNFSWDR